jgi:hypothetical protein
VSEADANAASTTDEATPKKAKDERLEEVVVTISNEDISARGFADVAEALQRASQMPYSRSRQHRGGAQYESTSPMWAYKRTLTRQVYAQGSSPQTAERDYLVYGVFGQPNGDTYYFEDPANCANVAGQFSNTVSLQTRTGHGQHCGTNRDANFTIDNGDQQVQFYLHATYDLNDNLQLYGDTLISHDVVRFSIGPSYYASSKDSSSQYSYYDDPALGGGAFGTHWKWLADMTYTDNKLTESTHLFFTQPIEAFFAPIF